MTARIGCFLCGERYLSDAALLWHLCEDHGPQLSRLPQSRVRFVIASIRDAADRRHKFPVKAHRGLRPHGTHAAFTRHRKAGQEPCEACWDGEREYQRSRQRARVVCECGVEIDTRNRRKHSGTARHRAALGRDVRGAA